MYKLYLIFKIWKLTIAGDNTWYIENHNAPYWALEKYEEEDGKIRVRNGESNEEKVNLYLKTLTLTLRAFKISHF